MESTYSVEVLVVGAFSLKVSLGRVDCDLGRTGEELSADDLDE